LAGGAVYAGPALNRSLAIIQAAAPTTQPNANPTDVDAARNRRGRQRGKAALLAPALIKASAEVTATQPKDVLAALRDSKTLSQYAKDHGKRDADVIAAARKHVQDRLNQALGNGKLTSWQSYASRASSCSTDRQNAKFSIEKHRFSS
jgi:hypothetical protein